MENKNLDKNEILVIKNLKKYFPIKKSFFGKTTVYLKAVDDVSFSVAKGKTLGIVGESGCGKTTLGRTILQLYNQTGGKTLYYGRTIEEFFPKYLINDVKLLKSNFQKILNLKEKLNTVTDETEKNAINEEIKSLKLEAASFSGAFILADDINEIYELLLQNIKFQHHYASLKDKRKKVNNYLVTLKQKGKNKKENQDEEVNARKINKLTDVIKKLDDKMEEIDNSVNEIKAKLRENKEKITVNDEFLELENARIKGIDLARLEKKELIPLREDLQIIFQDPYSSLSPRMPVGEIIGEAVSAHHLIPKSELKDYIFKVMKQCGLQTYYYQRYPHEFSGGQRQRIGIARSLALMPKIVICDEPVSALDVSIQAQIINLLKDLQEQFGLTYIFISHDLSVVEHISDSVGVMYLGNLVEIGSKENIFTNPLHPYTKVLFSAVPNPDPRDKMNRIKLEGEIPSPTNPPSGCKFHTRCKNCMDICKIEVPEQIEIEEGHFVSCHLYKNKDAK